MSNFVFLKKVDKDLFDIINDAEKLYRDEYFEQSILQTRRFAESVCKHVLGDRRTTERTFDDMLATLKDKSTTSEQEKEFISDLYFIKREGNNSVHSSKVKQDGIVALECLQRAFEVGINYAVYYCKNDSNLLKLRYDTEMLITGEKTKTTLAEKYEKEKNEKIVKKVNKKTKTVSTKPKKTFFKYIVTFATFVSLLIFLIMVILVKI